MSKKEMTKKEIQKVKDKIEWEGGYEYFITGSTFPEYSDPDFRSLVCALQKAWLDMDDFLGMGEEEDEDFDGEDEDEDEEEEEV